MASSLQPPSYEQFTRLFLSSEREILRYILVLVPNLNDAQDILQETAIALWGKFDQYDPAQPFVPWACRFAMYEARDFQRRSSRWRAFSDEQVARRLVERQGQTTTPPAQWREHLQQCLGKLNQKQKATIQAYYFDQMSVAELAKKGHRTTEAVYKSLQRIRGLLLDCVRRLGAGEAER